MNAPWLTYIVRAIDTEGETILDDERVYARNDKGAWAEGVRRALQSLDKKHTEGILAGRLAEMRVTRL